MSRQSLLDASPIRLALVERCCGRDADPARHLARDGFDKPLCRTRSGGGYYQIRHPAISPCDVQCRRCWAVLARLNATPNPPRPT